MPRRQRATPKKETVMEALRKNFGLVTQAAASLGYGNNREQFYRFIKRYELEQYLKDCREVSLDVAEGKLIENINAGKEVSTLFFLKTIGKNRGYVERQELTGMDGAPINVQVTNFQGAAQLKKTDGHKAAS